jgi:hypothetical protein
LSIVVPETTYAVCDQCFYIVRLKTGADFVSHDAAYQLAHKQAMRSLSSRRPAERMPVERVRLTYLVSYTLASNGVHLSTLCNKGLLGIQLSGSDPSSKQGSEKYMLLCLEDASALVCLDPFVLLLCREDHLSYDVGNLTRGLGFCCVHADVDESFHCSFILPVDSQVNGCWVGISGVHFGIDEMLVGHGAAEITLFDDVIVVYKFLGDLMFFVTGTQDENELILYQVLQAFYESISLLLRCGRNPLWLLCLMDSLNASAC